MLQNGGVLVHKVLQNNFFLALCSLVKMSPDLIPVIVLLKSLNLN